MLPVGMVDIDLARRGHRADKKQVFLHRMPFGLEETENMRGQFKRGHRMPDKTYLEGCQPPTGLVVVRNTSFGHHVVVQATRVIDAKFVVVAHRHDLVAWKGINQVRGVGQMKVTRGGMEAMLPVTGENRADEMALEWPRSAITGTMVLCLPRRSKMPQSAFVF